jgi:hypothetical protein
MAYDRLICHTCQLPIASPPANSATGMACPRCNSWIEIDPRCTGGCLSCHNTRGKDLQSSCTTGEEVVVAIELTKRAQSRDLQSPEKSSNIVAAKGLKALFKRLFAVR